MGSRFSPHMRAVALAAALSLAAAAGFAQDRSAAGNQDKPAREKAVAKPGATAVPAKAVQEKAPAADAAGEREQARRRANSGSPAVSGSRPPAIRQDKFGPAVEAVGSIRPKSAAAPECDEAAVMNGDRPMIPQGASNAEPPVTQLGEDMGAVASLYPGADAAPLYPLPCDPSIGGTLPNGALAEPSAGEVAAENFLNGFGANDAGRDEPQSTRMSDFTIGPCSIRGLAVPCGSDQFLMANQPFEGRDIIYVHGLAMEHLKKWLGNSPAAHRLWPQDASEFLDPNGYYRTYARDYWAGHLRENLHDILLPNNANAGYEWTGSGPTYRPRANRVLLIAWSSNQRLAGSQDAMLAQIRLAITDGTNVITPNAYPKYFQKPFCANGCIIVSHSTGGLLTSTALSRAANGAFGKGGMRVANQVRAHVAFEGAFSGSRIAEIAVKLGLAGSAVPGAVQNVLCPLQDYWFALSNTCGLNTAFVVSTVLFDLMPQISQARWGPVLDNSPVPTVTVAGGHPMGNQGGATSFLLPGIDDGVLSMNSACANPNKVQPGTLAASGAQVSSLVKAFDMGMSGARAVKFLLAQRNYRGPSPVDRYLAGACTPFLSPAGMVMPVENTMSGNPWDTRRRCRNHYSFIQGTMDHAHDGGGDSSNPWPTTTSASASMPRNYLNAFGSNNEETSAITDPQIYKKIDASSYLVHPSFAAQLHEYRSGRSIRFRLFGKTRRIWIWKRTYHLLDHWQQMSGTHYAYAYVARR